jgi:hypothetical protein
MAPKIPPTFFDSLADYPPWLVAACVTVVVAGLIWVLVKLLKWALWIALIAVLLVGAATVAGLLLQ